MTPNTRGTDTYVGFQFEIKYPNDVQSALREAADWIAENVPWDVDKPPFLSIGFTYAEDLEKMELRIYLRAEHTNIWEEEEA